MSKRYATSFWQDEDSKSDDEQKYSEADSDHTKYLVEPQLREGESCESANSKTMQTFKLTVVWNLDPLLHILHWYTGIHVLLTMDITKNTRGANSDKKKNWLQPSSTLSF